MAKRRIHKVHEINFCPLCVNAMTPNHVVSLMTFRDVSRKLKAVEYWQREINDLVIQNGYKYTDIRSVRHYEMLKENARRYSALRKFINRVHK